MWNTCDVLCMFWEPWIVFSLRFEPLPKSHVDKRLKTAVRWKPYQFHDAVTLPQIRTVTTFAVMKQKVKVHELGTELGQVGTRYGCRWFGHYSKANKTVGRTNVSTLTGNTGKKVLASLTSGWVATAWVDEWMEWRLSAPTGIFWDYIGWFLWSR